MCLKQPAFCSLLLAIVLLAVTLPFSLGQFCRSPCSIVNLKLTFPARVEAGQPLTIASTSTFSCYLPPKIRVDLLDAASNMILATTSLLLHYSSTGSYLVSLADHATARSILGSWALVLRAYVIDRASGFSVGWYSQLFQVVVTPYSSQVAQTISTTAPSRTFATASQPMLSTVGREDFTGELTSAGNPTIGVCYSPGYVASDCVSLIVYWIGRANSTVHVFTYGLTSPNITNALIEAAARRVDVKVALGIIHAESRDSQYGNLTRAGLNVRLSSIPDEIRDKLFIIDGHIVLWESFGWDEINYFNDEKFLVFDSTTLAAAYEQEFQTIWNASA